jgi:CRISPR-associated endonuclease/helicase Cas3
MYQLLDVKRWIGNSSIWAHTKEGKPSETLFEHSKLCLDYYNEYCKAKGIEKIVQGIITACGCTDEEVKIIYNMFVNAIYLHDIGKINPCYQSRRLNNPVYRDMKWDYDGNSNHALPSAYIYMCEYMPLIEGKNKRKLSYYLFAFAYCIARHHGYLKNMDGFRDDIMVCPVGAYYNKPLDLININIITSDTSDIKLKRILINETAFYILNKLMYAMSTACDYCATAEYNNGIKFKINTIDNIDGLLTNYTNGNIYIGITEYEKNKSYFKDSPINALRSDMLMEAEQQYRKNPDSNIYYLEAPTGSGKTENSINLMLNMIKGDPQLNNAFYIFPFNTLVEQTTDTLAKYFQRDIDFAIVNSITPIVMRDTEEPDYEYSYLEHIFNNYPIVVTSHVNFFNALFGRGREQVFPLVKLCNSVVIMDEIQSYKSSIWRHIIIFLNMYAKLLNIKIIMMSATLPKLDKMLEDDKGQFINLINEPGRYYQNPLFKDRVKVDLSLLKYEKIDLEVLADKVIHFNGKKVLVEFISKVSARKFYNILTRRSDLHVIELTGDDNTKLRKDMIKDIQASTSIIVVATQVIEAGIDIDMDIGFKDISTPDAEEQFLGRINRSCKKTGSIAYFFNYDNAVQIYKGDIRIHYPICNPHIEEMIVSKDFEGIYKIVLADLKMQTDMLNRNNIQYLYKACLKLQFDVIQEKMKLIESNSQVYIAYELKTDHESINGRDVWEEYKSISKNKDYAKKKVKLSMIAQKMSYFTYTVYGTDNMEMSCDETFGGYYYIQDGEKYMEDGKFNREAFSQSRR